MLRRLRAAIPTMTATRTTLARIARPYPLEISWPIEESSSIVRRAPVPTTINNASRARTANRRIDSCLAAGAFPRRPRRSAARPPNQTPAAAKWATCAETVIAPGQGPAAA